MGLFVGVGVGLVVVVAVGGGGPVKTVKGPLSAMGYSESPAGRQALLRPGAGVGAGGCPVNGSPLQVSAAMFTKRVLV